MGRSIILLFTAFSAVVLKGASYYIMYSSCTAFGQCTAVTQKAGERYDKTQDSFAVQSSFRSISALQAGAYSSVYRRSAGKYLFSYLALISPSPPI